MDLDCIQNDLLCNDLDGWLFYDFRRSNDLACHFLKIGPEKLLTRRFFYWIPCQGTPVKIVHAIENPLEHLPGETVRYHRWQELEECLQKVLEEKKQIAMEYSPRNAIPYVSKIDAGTIDVVRGFGVKVVSSCHLLQKYSSVWTPEQFQSHLEAAKVLDQTVNKAWDFIFDRLSKQQSVSEYDVQQMILAEFEINDCITADFPICAVNGHSADPHYTPTRNKFSLIHENDFILIDLWCKKNSASAVYADITRVGVAAMQPTEKQQKIFQLVKEARDGATIFVKESFKNSIPIQGCEVDDVCRDVINRAGYGSYFIHRTGHNIDMSDHGPGANIDNLETRDERILLPGTCFSIEPGIYLPDEFGVRLEYDLYIHFDGQVQITGGIQNELVHR